MNTELVKISVTDIDGVHAEDEVQERNILRERTFNNELTNLVNQIFINETVTENSFPPKPDIDHHTKNRLLIRCEDALYRLKHLDESARYITYNPFNADIDVYDDIDDMTEYLSIGMKQAGFSDFMLLVYSFKDKAFRKDINFMGTKAGNNIFFSLKDPVFSVLNDSSEGYVFTRDSIGLDRFLQKKFYNGEADADASASFYLVKLTAFLKNTSGSIYSSDISLYESLLSPLLLIRLSVDNTLSPGNILSKLKSYASIPMIMYFYRFRSGVASRNYSMEDIILLIELLTSSEHRIKLIYRLLELKKNNFNDNVFILRYIMSKLIRRLGSDSLIVRVSFDRVLLIFPADLFTEVKKIVNSTNLHEEIMLLSEIDDGGCLDKKKIINLLL